MKVPELFYFPHLIKCAEVCIYSCFLFIVCAWFFPVFKEILLWWTPFSHLIWFNRLNKKMCKLKQFFHTWGLLPVMWCTVIRLPSLPETCCFVILAWPHVSQGFGVWFFLQYAEHDHNKLYHRDNFFFFCSLCLVLHISSNLLLGSRVLTTLFPWLLCQS